MQNGIRTQNILEFWEATGTYRDSGNRDFQAGENPEAAVFDAFFYYTLQALKDLDNSIEFGLIADRPAASSSNENYIYIATDSKNVYYSDGTQWIRISTPAGTLKFHTGDIAPNGFVVPEGSELSRTTYSELWQHAQNSGMLVTEADWQGGQTTFYSDGDGTTTFRLPDYRGELFRAWDNGRGVDSGRTIGSWQADEIKSHRHDLLAKDFGFANDADVGGNELRFDGSLDQYYTSYKGGSETRPRNVALLPIIKY